MTMSAVILAAGIRCATRPDAAAAEATALSATAAASGATY